jgi:glycosyltransferase involved in cell wall biosynthesis
MRIAVLNNMAPFIWGGAEELTAHLVANLKAKGCSAEAFRIPFSWNPPERLVDEIVMCSNIRLRNIDRVIALKFPAYLVPHPSKVFWLLHQYRQAYDLWDADLTNLPKSPEGNMLREIVVKADQGAFLGARAIYTNSAVTRGRLLKYNGIPSDVLMPPLNDPELFTGGPYGDYILAAGRINSGKRQHLLIEALRHAPRSCRLVVAGPPDTPSDAANLEFLVDRFQLSDRVTLDMRLLTRSELAAWVNGARAVAYLPFDEDSVGYVTMEAFEAGKAVLTTADSGGVLQLVRHEETGLVCASQPSSLAQAMARLVEVEGMAQRLGGAGRDLWRKLDITWPATVEKLVS